MQPKEKNIRSEREVIATVSWEEERASNYEENAKHNMGDKHVMKTCNLAAEMYMHIYIEEDDPPRVV